MVAQLLLVMEIGPFEVRGYGSKSEFPYVSLLYLTVGTVRYSKET